MSYTEQEYLNMSADEYNEPNPKKPNLPSYSTVIGGRPVAASTSGTSYEQNGLQASIVNDHGQYTVVFRGSQGIGSSAGNKDWLIDAGLNNPQGYQDASSQFKDADAWINHEQQAGNLPKDLSNVTFTGHSLGGGLAQYEAAKNDAYAVSFSGPSPWNMLTPEERSKINGLKIKNLRREDDAIPNMPPGVQKIGQQIFVAGKTNWFNFIIGAGGHDYANDSYAIKNGNLVRDNQLFASAVNGIYSSTLLPGLIGKVAPVIAGEQGVFITGTSAVNNLFQGKWGEAGSDLLDMVGQSFKLDLSISELFMPVPIKLSGNAIENIAGGAVNMLVNVLGGGSGAMVGKVLSIKDPIDRAATELLLLHQNLDNIQKANNKIIPDMENALSDVKTTTLDVLGWMGLTIGDIDDIVYETHSDVKHHVNKDAISEVNQLVEKKKQEIQTVADGLKTTAANKLAHDQAWAAAFGG